MARRSATPRPEIVISQEQRERAIASNSSACLIADALKAQGYHRPRVDMAAISFTDRERGMRFHYVTPQAAQLALLWFDQGWQVEGDQIIRLGRPVKAVRVLAESEGTKVRRAERRAERLAELEAKEADGELSAQDKRNLSQIRNPKPKPKRATSRGRTMVRSDGTMVGGEPPVMGPPHPGMLRGVTRVFGAKLADPGEAFRQAVAEAVAAQLAGEDAA